MLMPLFGADSASTITIDPCSCSCLFDFVDQQIGKICFTLNWFNWDDNIKSFTLNCTFRIHSHSHFHLIFETKYHHQPMMCLTESKENECKQQKFDRLSNWECYFIECIQSNSIGELDRYKYTKISSWICSIVPCWPLYASEMCCLLLETMDAVH